MLKPDNLIRVKSRICSNNLSEFRSHCLSQMEFMERLSVLHADGKVHCTWIGIGGESLDLPGTNPFNIDNRIIDFGLKFYNGICGCLLYHLSVGSRISHEHVFEDFTKRCVVVPITGSLVILNGDQTKVLGKGYIAEFHSPTGGFTTSAVAEATWLACFKQFHGQLDLFKSTNML